MFHFFKPKISPKKPHELFLGGRKKLSFKLFRWSLSPPFHTKQADKPRWFHDSTGSFFWFAHSGHDPLLVALAYSICRDGNKKKIQKMKLPSHFHGRTEKKKEKKTRRIQIWRRRQTFGEFFGGQKIFQQKISVRSASNRLGHPTVAWKASHVDSGLRELTCWCQKVWRKSETNLRSHHVEP